MLLKYICRQGRCLCILGASRGEIQADKAVFHLGKRVLIIAYIAIKFVFTAVN